MEPESMDPLNSLRHGSAGQQLMHHPNSHQQAYMPSYMGGGGGAGSGRGGGNFPNGHDGGGPYSSQQQRSGRQVLARIVYDFFDFKTKH